VLHTFSRVSALARVATQFVTFQASALDTRRRSEREKRRRAVYLCDSQYEYFITTNPFIKPSRRM